MPTGRTVRTAVSERRWVGNHRPGRTASADASWVEGLPAGDPGAGDGVRLFAAPSVDGLSPSIRAEPAGDQLQVSADGDVTTTFHAPRYSGLPISSDRLRALAAWGVEATPRPSRPGPTTPFVP